MLAGASSGLGVALLPPPALPAQPPLHTAPACPPGVSPGAPDSWTELMRETSIETPAWQVAVDPAHPCTMFRATTAQDIQRSTDSGATWQADFHDAASSALPTAAVTKPFNARDLQLTSTGDVVLAEDGNGDAVVRGDQQGTRWHLADSGIEGRQIAAVTPAPGHPDVIYATVDDATSGSPAGALTTPVGMDVTKDGGASWSFATFPTALVDVATNNDDSSAASNHSIRTPQIQIDPRDPAHIWAMFELTTQLTNQGVGTVVIVETHDWGGTWGAPVFPPVVANQFLVELSPTHGPRLYLADCSFGSQGLTPIPAPEVSSDDGQTWTTLPVDGMAYASLAADPADPDVMAYAGWNMNTLGLGSLTQLDYYVTYDSWDTAQFGTPVRNQRDPLLPSTPLKNGRTDDLTVLAQGDEYGHFYFLLAQQCDGYFVGRCWADDPPNAGVSQIVRQSFFRLTPKPPPAPRRAGTGSPADVAPPSAQPPTAKGIEMRELKDCQVPLATGGSADQSGALTFDGDSLLYTHLYETSVQPYQGIVRRMDPQTCSERDPLVVNFDPNDLAKVAVRDEFPDEATHPYIDTLTYDPNHDSLWVSLRTGNNVGTYTVRFAACAFSLGLACPIYPLAAVFAAHIDRSHGAPVATARLRWFGPSGETDGNGVSLFSYDDTDDTLWTVVPDPRAGEAAGHVTPDNRQIPSCFSKVGAGATWVLGAPGVMYVQAENDESIFEADTQSCNLMQTYHHRNFNEPVGEDEQMACDALTFGPNSPYSGGLGNPGTSAIWLRDSINQLLVAYQLPDAVCPFPTVTTFLGGHEVVRGQAVQLCALLVRDGTRTPLPGLPIQFSVGRTQLGSGQTNLSGEACIKPRVTLPPNIYTVAATFPGTPQYRASSDRGPLSVYQPGVGLSAHAFAPPIIPPNVAGPPPPTIQAVNVPAPAPGAGPAFQAQPQPNPVSQAQGQPISAAASEPQSQQELQLALSKQTLAEQQENSGQYAMVAQDHRVGGQAFGVAAGTVSFLALTAVGLRWVVRTPQQLIAAGQRRRSRRV